MKAEYEKAKKAMEKQARNLSKIRKEQAAILEEAICEGLKELNFPDVKFEIQFGKLAECGALGIDDVEFMISLNPGQPVKPLKDVASGGELPGSC